MFPVNIMQLLDPSMFSGCSNSGGGIQHCGDRTSTGLQGNAGNGNSRHLLYGPIDFFCSDLRKTSALVSARLSRFVV